jgi:hypothetical protein
MSGFDKLAKKGGTSGSKKASTRVAASVTPDISGKVDVILKHKAEIKRLEAEQKSAEQDIIEHVRPQQDNLARSGQFTKSLDVPGNTGSLTYVTADRFSVPQDEDTQGEVRNVIGEDKFDDFFAVVRTVSVKKGVLDDEEATGKLIGALEKAGLDISDFFDVEDKLAAKSDLDRKQYELDEDKLAVFRTLVKQSKPSLR